MSQFSTAFPTVGTKFRGLAGPARLLQRLRRMNHREQRRKKLARKRRRRGFTPSEQSFFAAGERLADEAPAPVDSFDDLDDGRASDSFWTRLARQPVLD